MPAGYLNPICRNQLIVMDSYMPSLQDLNHSALKWLAWIPSKTGIRVWAISAFASWSVTTFEVVLKAVLPHSQKKWRPGEILFLFGVLTYWESIWESGEWSEGDCRNFRSS